MQTVLKEVNVASKQSTHGHFCKGAKQVILLDDVLETSLIEGASVLTSQNHTDLQMKSDCLITIQSVYEPFSQQITKSRD